MKAPSFYLILFAFCAIFCDSLVTRNFVVFQAKPVNVVPLDSWQVDGTKYRAQLLKSYIERRGVNVPSGFVQPKVFLVNPDCK